MSSEELPTSDPCLRPLLQLPLDLQQELSNRMRTYRHLPSPKPVFNFVQDLPAGLTREHRLSCLQLLQPKTELQLEYFLEPNTQPDNWGVTFPHRTSVDIFDRFGAAQVDRTAKTTWKQFRESHVADVFMQHIDTVVFAARWAMPSYMQLTVRFDREGGPLDIRVSYHFFKSAYERLDLEYIKLEVEKVTLRWKEVWKPAAMTFEVIQKMAKDLGKMHREMVW